jgi:hypothetical protein
MVSAAWFAWPPATYLQGRTDVQCLHRWQKVLNPNLVKGGWTQEVSAATETGGGARLVCTAEEAALDAGSVEHLLPFDHLQNPMYACSRLV